MKTKYILHGGFRKGEIHEDNSHFYAEILKDAPQYAKILLVCFAKDDDRIPLATTKVMDELNKNKWQKSLDFEIANDSTFIEQISSADIIYFHGGTTAKLLAVLKKFSDLKRLFEGKIIAGESAGANVLAAFCYSPNADQVITCLGILPIKIIPHYCEAYKGKLDDVGHGLETVLLPEYKFKIVEIP